MKTKHLSILLILISMAATNPVQAQTGKEFLAEEFLAEVFFGYMTAKSPKTYIEKDSYLPIGIGSKEIPDSLMSEIGDYIVQSYANNGAMAMEWNEKAPVFQQPKYKNLIFVDDGNSGKLSHKKRKKMGETDYSKPAFTKNREYAVIDVTYSNLYLIKRSWKWNWKKPWKLIPKRQYESHGSIYRKLYRRVDGKWVEIGSYIIGHTF